MSTNTNRLVRSKNIKAIAFDGWGTLFERAGASLIATSKRIVDDSRLSMGADAFLNLWRNIFDEDISSFATIRSRNVTALSKAFEALSIHQNAEKYVRYLIDECWANSPVYPEVARVLEAIRLPKCVISNIDDDTLSEALASNGLAFEHLMTSERARAYKPDPKIFRDALRMIGCDSSELLYVGDSQRDDVKGARDVGITVVWINRGGVKLEKGIPRPDFEIADLKELLPILKRYGTR